MLDKIDDNVFDVFCDGNYCFEKFTVEGSFDDVIKELSKRNWKIRKAKYDWVHYCPECHGG